MIPGKHDQGLEGLPLGGVGDYSEFVVLFKGSRREYTNLVDVTAADTYIGALFRLVRLISSL